MDRLSSEWNNEAYVSLHLVQTMLEKAGLPRKSGYCHWYPEFKVRVPNLTTNGQIVWTEKEVDFLVEDFSRYINFLVEVKTANTQINDDARVQLETYLQYSYTRFGVLIDPFLIEIYEYTKGQSKLRFRYDIENPNKPDPVAVFIKNFLDTIKMRTIAIHTSKGGVGKTTLVVNIAYEIAKQGKRVLVIDLDDQANASLCLGVNKADEFDKASTLDEIQQILDYFTIRKEAIEFMRDYTKDGFNYKDYILASPFNKILELGEGKGKIDVLPSSYKTLDDNLGKKIGDPHKRLNNALQRSGIAVEYDYVIIDTPPSSTDITGNGLCAAQYVVIPSQMEYLSVYGIRTVVRRLRDVQEATDSKRGIILGIVPMMTEKKVTLHTNINNLVNQTFPGIKIFPEISRSVNIGQASYARKPLSLFAQQNKGSGVAAKQFSTLTESIINMIEQMEMSGAM